MVWEAYSQNSFEKARCTVAEEFFEKSLGFRYDPIYS